MYKFLKDRIMKKVHRFALTRKKNNPSLKGGEYKRILLCNLAHIGDVILATSVFAALKRRFPTSEIGFLCGSWSSQVLWNQKEIAHVHVFDQLRFNRSKKSLLAKWLQERRTRVRALREIRALNYDVAIDLYHAPFATPFCFQAGIKKRLGYMRRLCGLFLTHALKWQEKGQSVVSTHFELLQEVGVKEVRGSPQLPLLANKVIEFDILMHIGTGGELREWPVEKWRELALRCESEGYRVLYTGRGEREADQIAFITKNLNGAINLCDQLDFHEWVSLIARAPLVVNVNTSAGHVASCFQTKNIVLFCGIDNQKVWGPLNPNAKLLMKQVPCYPCYKGCASMSCIRDISVDEVFREIKCWVQ